MKCEALGLVTEVETEKAVLGETPGVYPFQVDIDMKKLKSRI